MISQQKVRTKNVQLLSITVPKPKNRNKNVVIKSKSHKTSGEISALRFIQSFL